MSTDNHVNESILNSDIKEWQKKNRIDHMAYLPGMEVLESEVQAQVIESMNAYDYTGYTEKDVRRALEHDNRTPEDFAALLSPAALPLLEEMAQRARIETRKHFGNGVYMFTPIYIANYCENFCIYCGFNCHNKINRAQLNEEEIDKEMQEIAKTGLQEILILTGESRSKSTVEYIGKACRIARKYFRDEDPVGKILIFNSNMGKMSCEVTGVMKEMPSNSHIHYNFLLSYATLPKWVQEYWYKHEAYTYVLLDSPERKEEIEGAFPQLAEKYKTEEALKNKTWGVRLEPLEQIHLNPQLGYEAELKGNRSAIIALIFGAIAILIIAWINYINLTVARSMERAKEVGCAGSGTLSRNSLSINSFRGIVMNLIAFVIALGLIELLLLHSISW